MSTSEKSWSSTRMTTCGERRRTTFLPEKCGLNQITKQEFYSPTGNAFYIYFKNKNILNIFCIFICK